MCLLDERRLKIILKHFVPLHGRNLSLIGGLPIFVNYTSLNDVKYLFGVNIAAHLTLPAATIYLIGR